MNRQFAPSVTQRDNDGIDGMSLLEGHMDPFDRSDDRNPVKICFHLIFNGGKNPHNVIVPGFLFMSFFDDLPGQVISPDDQDPVTIIGYIVIEYVAEKEKRHKDRDEGREEVPVDQCKIADEKAHAYDKPAGNQERDDGSFEQFKWRDLFRKGREPGNKKGNENNDGKEWFRQMSLKGGIYPQC